MRLGTLGDALTYITTELKRQAACELFGLDASLFFIFVLTENSGRKCPSLMVLI